jgi:hypothetical protein
VILQIVVVPGIGIALHKVEGRVSQNLSNNQLQSSRGLERAAIAIAPLTENVE